MYKVSFKVGEKIWYISHNSDDDFVIVEGVVERAGSSMGVAKYTKEGKRLLLKELEKMHLQKLDKMALDFNRVYANLIKCQNELDELG